jgi:hypothetical protein
LNPFLRAATVCAALFISPPSNAKTLPSQHQEANKDVIERAFSLCLQKDRLQAIGMLRNAMRAEKKIEHKKVSKSNNELQEALFKVSTMFLSEKAQQLFELGISLRATAPSTALQKMMEADRIDIGNLTIGLEIVRIMIINGDCSGANVEAKKLKAAMLDSEAVDLTLAQSEICLGQLDNFRTINAQRVSGTENLSRFWLELEIELAHKSGNFEQGKNTIQALEKLDPQFPETFYWKWRIFNELNQSLDSAANKYLNLCKSISTKSQREYLPDPWLCRRVSEVESFVKKTNNNNQ